MAAAMEADPDAGIIQTLPLIINRNTLLARYSPTPFRVVSAAYRIQRGQSEQLDMGWQWPLGQPFGDGARWYSVGRFNYSLQDRRPVDALPLPDRMERNALEAHVLAHGAADIEVPLAVLVALAAVARGQLLGHVAHQRPHPVHVAPVEQQSPQGLYALHKADIEKWWPIIKAANIKPE